MLWLQTSSIVCLLWLGEELGIYYLSIYLKNQIPDVGTTSFSPGYWSGLLGFG